MNFRFSEGKQHEPNNLYSMIALFGNFRKSSSQLKASTHPSRTSNSFV